MALVPVIEVLVASGLSQTDAEKKVASSLGGILSEKTNIERTIENVNRGIRKYTKTKTQFPNENAAAKSIYLSIKNIEEAWTKPIPNWGLILHQFMIIFENRCKL